MIVAAYTSGSALWATVVPVTAIMRFDRHAGQRQREQKQPDKKAAFATMLLSVQSELDAAEGQEVDFRA